MLLKPKVTVVICNYNYGRFIKDAIDSVINQTYPCNMVIVDDGSNDNSWNIIKTYFKSQQENIKDGIIFVVDGEQIPNLAIKIPNSIGPSAARNLAILNMIGYTDYYQILDADDLMYPTKIEKLVSKAVSDSRIGVVYGDYDILNIQTGNTIREYKEPFSIEKLSRECIVHSGALVSKQALMSVRDQFGIYDEQMRTAEDFDLWLRIAKKWLICHVPEALTLVRVHKDNSTNTVDKETWQRNWQRIQMKNSQ